MSIGLRCDPIQEGIGDRKHATPARIVTSSRLELTRPQILAFRRHVGALDERLPRGRRSLRRAAWAGLQDSMPRAALLSIHARVEGTQPSTWEDPSLVQFWGPRYHAYVVAARDLAIFSLGRLPDDPGSLQVAEDLAARLHTLLDGERMTYGEAGSALGEHPNRLRYAATIGTVLIRWDGARQPTVWTVAAPTIDSRDARLELARRYLHIFGPVTPEAFAEWAGLSAPRGRAAFDALRRSLTPVRTPVGDAWILKRDEPTFRAAPGPVAPTRLLPSGDTYFLCQGADRELLVPDADRRRALWTSRVWPGAVLVEGEIVGTWRRAQATVTIQTWRRLSRAARAAVEAEAESLPLPGIEGQIVVRWD
ncbi:MAG: crosslink repair DNA glycosylase YcaQ family protein [Actinomycetota bacterium]